MAPTFPNFRLDDSAQPRYPPPSESTAVDGDAISGERLLDFGGDHIDSFSVEDARQRLAGPHRELYRSHLLLAHHLEAWAARNWAGVPEDERARDFERALLEVAAHLRLGDYLPGGGMYPTMGEDVPT